MTRDRYGILLCCALGCSPPSPGVGNLGDGSGDVTGMGGTLASETAAESTAAGSTGPIKLDAGTTPDDPLDHGCSPGPDDMPSMDGGEGGGTELGFSNVWVSDTNAAVVLKIDTHTLEERARYRTHASALALPSRTSVSLNGDVAIANRGQGMDGIAGQSGVTVIATREEDCVDRNGDGMLQTSSGPGDVLAWGDDECVLWHRSFDARSNRPVAWTTGVFDEDSCRWVDTLLWTATSHTPGTARVLLLDGDDGEIVGDVVIEGWASLDERIVYGGAVDSHNDFWFIPPAGNQLGHVRLSDLSYEVIDGPEHANYGVMVDADDRVWIGNGSVFRYDPATATWASGDCQCTQLVQTPSGAIWTNALAEIDPVTLTLHDHEPTADMIPWGLSVDAEGGVIGVYFDHIVRVDTESGATQVGYPKDIQMFYTYSDMTGWGLANVATPAG